MVVIGAAMRKLIHIVYGVLKSGKPFTRITSQNHNLPLDFQDGIYATSYSPQGENLSKSYFKPSNVTSRKLSNNTFPVAAFIAKRH